MKEKLEETRSFTPQFSPALHRDRSRAPDLIQVILQDAITKEVLFSPTMDKTALALTFRTKYIHVYSRTDKKTRQKGDESGDALLVVGVFVNCNQDTLLIMVKRLGPDGGVCHTRQDPNNPKSPHRKTCFYRALDRSLNNTFQYSLIMRA